MIEPCNTEMSYTPRPAARQSIALCMERSEWGELVEAMLESNNESCEEWGREILDRMTAALVKVEHIRTKGVRYDTMYYPAYDSEVLLNVMTAPYLRAKWRVRHG